MSDQEEKINQFKEITNTSEELARSILESTNWDIEVCFVSFFYCHTFDEPDDITCFYIVESIFLYEFYFLRRH